MTKKRWSDLSPGARRFIVVGGTFEAMLKIAALADLVQRPSEEIRGSKLRWGCALVVVNSVGLAPLAYFVYGRRA